MFQNIIEEFEVSSEDEDVLFSEGMVALVGGEFVTFWTARIDGETSFRARVFGEDGTSLSGEIEIDRFASGAGPTPAVTALVDGGFAVTWREFDAEDDPSAPSSAVLARVYTADGTTVGGEILVNTAVEGDQHTPYITSLANGGFAITWSDESFGVGGASGDADGFATKAQVFTADGLKIGSEILVNQETTGDQLPIGILGLADSKFAVLFASGDESSGFVETKLRVFNADGTPFLDEQTTAASEGLAYANAAPLAGGGFAQVSVIVELDINNNIVSDVVVGRLTDFGVLIGDTISLGDEVDPISGLPEVVALEDGGFVLVSVEDGPGSSGNPVGGVVKAHVFDATAALVGEEITIAEYTTGQPPELDGVEALPGGGFVVSWMDLSGILVEVPEELYKVKLMAQAFASSGEPISEAVTVHGETDPAFRSDLALAVLDNGSAAFSWSEVADVLEPENNIAAVVFSFGPEIISDGGGAAAALTVDENGAAVTTVVAEDLNTPALAYAIVGGLDAALFAIDPVTGELSFLTGPDFEASSDTDGDNVYEVVVSASDGILDDIQALSVTVANVAGQVIDGTQKKDNLIGGDEEDDISGFKKKDKLKGEGGNDNLDGGRHKDVLTGGLGDDNFIFASKLKKKWADKITDFTPGSDHIVLHSAIFKKLAPGDLDPDAFARGRHADEADDRIVHHYKSGKVFYDRDGDGKKKGILFATVDKKTDMSADDFMVI